MSAGPPGPGLGLKSEPNQSCVFTQLENRLGGQQVYQNRVTQHLVPCVGQFSVALADDSQWKTLNYQILLKTRHTDAKVSWT